MARQIRLLPRDITVSDVPGATLLESILASGARIRHSCNAGSCHICRAELIEGVVTTRDGTLLTADHSTPKPVLTCLCYPETDCILEIAHVLAKGELPQLTVACQIQDVEPLNHDVTRYLLKLPAGKPVEYYPGQYLDLVLNPDTEGERHFPFSIANAPDNSRLLELHIRDIPGSDSLELLKQALVPGEIIHARLPGGDCTLAHIYGEEALHVETSPLVFLAGSTGFAPVKAMIEYCFQEKLSRPVILYWGGRTRDDLYLHDLSRRTARAGKDAPALFTGH